MRVVQPFLVLAFAIIMVATMHPRDAVEAVTRIVLVIVTAGLLLTIPVPDRLIGPTTRLRIVLAASITAGVLMGLGGQGWPATFSYMVAVHSSIRFAPRVAVRIIAINVLIGIVVQLIWGATALTPWWANLLVLCSLVPGMARYARQQTLATANELVLQSQRTAESEARSRALAERAAIARDIHDVLAHSLSGVNMQLSLADALFDADRVDEGREAVRTARRMVVTGLDEARAAVQTLRGDSIDAVVAIERIVSGPGESFTVTGTPRPMPGRYVHTIVRTAQEAVTNARRHAPGAALDIELSFRPDAIDLTAKNAVAQNLPSDGDAGTGLGLVGMRERAAAIGADLEARPIAGDDPDHPGGWLVRLHIPDDHEEPT